MKMNKKYFFFLTGICFGLAAIGFMIRLPAAFRQMDKELHALFYFSAAAFLNLLLANRRIGVHILIFICLFLFGLMIEYAQEYSNTFFRRRIHGRFDPEDIKANLKGLVAFSMVWLVFWVTLGFRRSRDRHKPGLPG